MRLETTYSTLTWSADGTSVSKVRPASGDARRRFRNELRVNRLLADRRPPVPTPRLVAHDVQRRRLTFEAFAGEPLGPKYPQALDAGEVDEVVHLALRLTSYRPRRRWLRRLDPPRRLRLAHRAGLLDDADLARLLPRAAGLGSRLAFAHGDVTARNVLVGDRPGMVLIDWEWAGLYPVGYDLALLWYSLIQLPESADRVEHAARTVGGVDEGAFLLSALLVELWHLQWYLPAEFRPKHQARRDELLARLRQTTPRP